MWDPSCVCNLHTAHGNARPLTHWARLGIKSTSSWILVWLITTEPQRELHLLPVYRTSLSHGKQISWQQILLSFSSPENVLISTLFLVVVFTGYRILVDSSFLSSLEIYCAISFYFHVSDNKSYLNCFSPTGKVSFFSDFFQKSSLPLVLRSLIMICFGMDFFGFILYGVFSVSWVGLLMSLAKFEEFLVIIYFLGPFSFSDTNVTYLL